ncbi:glycine cleavage T C-terminal barrel domain-containing protein [uncultured Kiloniella sp.]|uniref:glycine cleavage T C-terminal barrel domain-containing protein n=1 Tax=uncultured Kiloniella sp. TaxID=1133091 RepID=UPI002637D4F6|nr:glycine cleavage T C-terminal barrel domain-containing protein [uncultured Kiloniella sp.]
MWGDAHYSQKTVAYGFLPTEIAKDGLEVEIEVLGMRLKAKMYTETLFDPQAERMMG